MTARLVDDGHRPELDVHGCTVDDAIALIRALIVKAVDRGRDSIRIIHGASTSGPNQACRTIKRALHELLDSRKLPLHIASSLRAHAYTIVALRSSSRRRNAQRITFRDLTR